MNDPAPGIDHQGLPALKFDSIEAAEDFIAGIRLTDTQHAAASIQRMLDGLTTLPPDARLLLEILEQLRLPLRFVIEALTHSYQDRALPLGEHEAAALQRVVTLLSTFDRGYRLCATPNDDESSTAHHALVLLRSLDCATARLYEAFRARQQIPAGLWLEIHRLYATASACSVAQIPVPDPLEGSEANTSCASIYLAALLTELAGPHAVTARELDLIRRWATMWAPFVTLQPLPEGLAPLQTVVSWTTDQPFCNASGHTPPSSTRYLETGPLLQHLGEIQTALQTGNPPETVGLGDSMPQLQARKLLAILQRTWSQARAPRRFQRHQAHGVARIVDGFPAICFALTGHEYAPPDSNALYSRKEYETLYTFRHMVDPTAELSIRPCPPEYRPAEWEVLDGSVTGFRLVRTGSGHRLAFRQLLGVLPHDGQRYLLAHISRLVQGRDGSLEAGIAMLPGLPEVITIRALSAHERGTPSTQDSAFLLSPLPHVSQHPCLILPKGWYRHGRELRLLGETEQSVVLLMELLFAGNDFDQVRYRTCN